MKMLSSHLRFLYWSRRRRRQFRDNVDVILCRVHHHLRRDIALFTICVSHHVFNGAKR